MPDFLSPRIAGTLLIVCAGLVLTGMVWHQETQIARAREQIAQSQLRPAKENPLAPHDADISILVSPLTVLPLAALFALAGWALLARDPSSASPPASPGQSQEAHDSAEAGSPGELLDRQRRLARSERTAVATEFAASMSHEIRNPMAGIQMSLANLISESKDHELRERLEALSSEAIRVTDLLTKAVAQSRDEPESSRPIELAAWIEDLFELLRFQIPENLRMEYEVEPDIRCHLPPDRLAYCLSNILTNSIRAVGGNPGWVRLEIETRAEYVALIVLDSGPGFPENILLGGARAFGAESQRGSGLGLSMVKRFVREMSGRIELSNAPPGSLAYGARVTILLPSASHHG